MAGETATTQRGILQRSELVLSFALLGLLVVFLVPLPTFLLDILLAFNLSATILVLLITLTVRQPLDFSTFPSLLLLLTLFRLALNVATTRLILLNGDAGEVVLAFGQFVVGGNLVVGMVIFLILIIIQFIVITKGAGRVSEVAARFTLDAMPGKQMAIDAELNAGLIDEIEARKRRAALMRESEFYGTMDGASRFVRGDAIAAVIITGVNLVGGIIIGMMKGQSIGQAITKYSILSIGDGLITQIPALITATASGMLVTKATSESSLGQEFGKQVQSAAGPVRLSAIIVLGLAIAPGMPMIPFLGLGLGLMFLAQRLSKPPKPQPVAPATPGEAGAGKANGTSSLARGSVSRRLPAQRSYQPGNRGGTCASRLGTTRAGAARSDWRLTARLARQSGLWVPAVRVRDNIQLDPPAYRILIGGREVARGEVRPDMWMAIDPGGASQIQLPGEVAREPAFGLPARWISEGDRSRAEMAGFTVVDAPSVIITHLGEIVRRHASELLSRDDLKAMVDRVRETSPAIVDELIPNVVSMGTLHRVLINLLTERIPISNITRILESLGAHSPTVKDVSDLTEKVRVDIGRAIADRFRDPNGRIRAIVLDPRLEVELRRMVQAHQLALDPARLEQLTLRLNAELRKANTRGFEVTLLCDSSMRRAMHHSLARAIPDLSVMSYQEIPIDLLMEPVAVIRTEDVAATGASSVGNLLEPTRST